MTESDDVVMKCGDLKTFPANLSIFWKILVEIDFGAKYQTVTIWTKKWSFFDHLQQMLLVWTKCCRAGRGVHIPKTSPGDTKVFKNTKIIRRHRVKPEKSHNSSKKNPRFFHPHPAKGDRPLTKKSNEPKFDQKTMFWSKVILWTHQAQRLKSGVGENLKKDSKQLFF